jgi:hypothetical protein
MQSSAAVGRSEVTVTFPEAPVRSNRLRRDRVACRLSHRILTFTARSASGHLLPMRLVPRLARCPEYAESRHEAPAQYLTRWAINELMQRSKQQLYSITSSARPSNGRGIVRPSALAVLRLMANSIFVICWTGRSAGFGPRPVKRTRNAADSEARHLIEVRHQRGDGNGSAPYNKRKR